MTSKKTELGISGRNSKRSLAIQSYVDRYQVSRRKVESIGVEWLDRMSEDARLLMLHYNNTKMRRTRTNVRKMPVKSVPRFTETQRIERMMHLARKVA